jgi:transposase
MTIREGNRQQLQMLPASIEQYIAEDAPVRAYDVFVEALDFGKLGIEIDPSKEGNPSYDPRAMLKLLVYGYSYGVRSSRKLEREVHYNLSFIWLMGGLKPDHKTIAEFRRKNKPALKKALIQCVHLCLKLDLIAGNVLFVDGSKIRGNASIKNSWTEEKCRKVLAQADRRIAEVISQAEAIDQQETGLPSLVAMRKELEDEVNLKQRVKEIMQELEATGNKSLNTVDKECTRVNNFQGTGAGYNAQVVADDKHGLIVSSDMVSTNNDLGQFAVQISQAQEVLGKPCETAVADSGYAFTDDLAKVDKQGIQVIVPTQRIASGREIREYDKRHFNYDSEKDCYICPRGQTLVYDGLSRKRFSKSYEIAQAEICLRCPAYGKCTTSKQGRKVMRLIAEEVRDRLEKEYALSENQAIYKRRQQKVELIFGHIKRNLGVSALLLRGREGAQAEMSLLSICFNLSRMITLLGQRQLIHRLRLASFLNIYRTNAENPPHLTNRLHTNEDAAFASAS